MANSNFQVLKCYILIIDFERIKKNIGEILMIFLFIILLILLIISCIIHQKKIHSYIDIILRNNLFNKSKEKLNENKSLNNKNGNGLKNKKKRRSGKPKNIKRKNNAKRKSKFYPPRKNFLRISAKNIKSIKSDNDNLIKKNIKQKYSCKSIDNSSLINAIHKINKSKNIETFNNNLKRTSGNKMPKFKATNKRNSIKMHKSENISINCIKAFNDSELNSLDYELAIVCDKRTYCQYYWSLLKKKQLILFAFIPNNDYNINTIKISLLLLSFSLYFTINGFFFSDETMHKVYEDNGALDILYQAPQILYSTLVSSFINIVLKILSLSEKDIIEIKKENNDLDARIKSKKAEYFLKIKFIIFFVLSILFMFFFCYFISCFCAVYINTQTILIRDTLISFGLSMIYPFGLNILPGIVRIPALRAKNKDKKTLYKFSLIIAMV